MKDFSWDVFGDSPCGPVPPPPAAVTVGKQRSARHLPSLRLPEQACAPQQAALKISDGYDDEASWHILQNTLLSAREMEGGDPFRSLM